MNNTQKQLVDFISSFIKENNRSPTLKEMALKFEVTRESMSNRVKTLIRKGILEEEKMVYRSIKLKGK